MAGKVPPFEKILRQVPAFVDQATRKQYKSMHGAVSVENMQLAKQIQELMKKGVPENDARVIALEMQRRPKGIQEMNMRTAFLAGAPKSLDEEAQLLLAPRLNTPEPEASGSMIFRPGAHDDVKGIPKGSVYVEGLASEVPGGGTQLLKELERLYPGAPMHLESMRYPETLDFYQKKGFVELPRDREGLNVLGDTPIMFLKPPGVTIKAEGGSVNARKGDKKGRNPDLQLTVTPRDVEYGRLVDKWRQKRDAEEDLARRDFERRVALRKQLQKQQNQVETEHYNAMNPRSSVSEEFMEQMPSTVLKRGDLRAKPVALGDYPSMSEPTGPLMTADQRSEAAEQAMARGITGGTTLPLGVAVAGAMGPAVLGVPTSLAGRLGWGTFGGAMGALEGSDPSISALSMLHPLGQMYELGKMMYGDSEEPTYPVREAQAGKIPRGSFPIHNIDPRRLEGFDKLWHSVPFPEATPEQVEALRAYTRSSSPFKPQTKGSRAAIESAVASGILTPKQAENMGGTRQALTDLLMNDLQLRGPIYRGVALKPDEVPRISEIVGGKGGPASFSYDPGIASNFMEDTGAGKKSVFLTAEPGKVKGVMVPHWLTGLDEAEGELVLHPDTNFIPYQAEESGNLFDLLGTFRHGLEPHKTAWAQGGSVPSFAGGGLARIGARLGKEAAPARRGIANVVKEKGGNWLKDDVENAMYGLTSPLVRPLDTMTPEIEAINRHREPLNNWVNKQLKNYVKNEMATPEDPVRALAERGVLHSTGLAPANAENAALSRKAAGTKALAQSDLAKQWEDLSDTAIQVHKAGDFNTPSNILDENPWLTKVDPAAKVNWLDDPYNTPENLGFNHLIDELKNATRADSDLPRELRWTPEQLAKVSMPQAVERVAKINEWRAAQKAEVDKLKANNAATVLHKEYPENNPLGLRWVELKAPDRFHTPEQREEFGDIGRYAQKTLADALKYEGDTMGHCVGGYCDDVISGRSRIFSLRDPKGEPHVTIETINEAKADNPDYIYRYKMTPERQAEVDKLWNRDDHEQKAWYEAIMSSPEYREYMSTPSLASIAQIKGKQNLAPKAEYLPFVQDFVKSGKWSDVGDITNAGMRKGPFIHPVTGEDFGAGEYLTADDVSKLLKAEGFPEANISGHLRSYGFAQGGSVGWAAAGTPASWSTFNWEEA